MQANMQLAFSVTTVHCDCDLWFCEDDQDNVDFPLATLALPGAGVRHCDYPK